MYHNTLRACGHASAKEKKKLCWAAGRSRVSLEVDRGDVHGRSERRSTLEFGHSFPSPAPLLLEPMLDDGSIRRIVPAPPQSELKKATTTAKYIRDDASLRGLAQKRAKMMPQIDCVNIWRSKLGRIGTDKAQTRRAWAKSGRKLAKLGSNWPMFSELGPDLGNICSIVASIGQVSADCPNLVRGAVTQLVWGDKQRVCWGIVVYSTVGGESAFRAMFLHKNEFLSFPALLRVARHRKMGGGWVGGWGTEGHRPGLRASPGTGPSAALRPRIIAGGSDFGRCLVIPVASPPGVAAGGSSWRWIGGRPRRPSVQERGSLRTSCRNGR